MIFVGDFLDRGPQQRRLCELPAPYAKPGVASAAKQSVSMATNVTNEIVSLVSHELASSFSSDA
jgi:hypothetical protein